MGYSLWLQTLVFMDSGNFNKIINDHIHNKSYDLNTTPSVQKWFCWKWNEIHIREIPKSKIFFTENYIPSKITYSNIISFSPGTLQGSLLLQQEYNYHLFCVSYYVWRMIIKRTIYYDYINKQFDVWNYLHLESPLNVLTYLVRKNKRGNVAFEI